MVQSPLPVPVTTVELPEPPALATLELVVPLPECTVTELPAPVVDPLTRPPPAVTLLVMLPDCVSALCLRSITLQSPGLSCACATTGSATNRAARKIGVKPRMGASKEGRTTPGG